MYYEGISRGYGIACAMESILSFTETRSSTLFDIVWYSYDTFYKWTSLRNEWCCAYVYPCMHLFINIYSNLSRKFCIYLLSVRENSNNFFLYNIKWDISANLGEIFISEYLLKIKLVSMKIRFKWINFCFSTSNLCNRMFRILFAKLDILLTSVRFGIWATY